MAAHQQVADHLRPDTNTGVSTPQALAAQRGIHHSPFQLRQIPLVDHPKRIPHRARLGCPGTGHPSPMTADRGRTEHAEDPAEGDLEQGEEAEARVREQQEDTEE